MVLLMQLFPRDRVLSPMKVLIIGGTSLIGPYLIQEILVENYEVATFTRSGKNYFTETSFQGDRNNKGDLQKVINEYNPQVIVDMIPFTKEQSQILSEVIIDKNIFLIALSSIDVYSAYAKINKTENVEYQKCPILETDLLRSDLGPEGESYNKLAIEKIYFKEVENVSILRLPAVYGSPETSRIDDYLIPMLQKKKEIFISPQRKNWKFSRALNKNVAFGIFLVIKNLQFGKNIYNIAEKNVFTEIEWIEKIANICGWKGKILENNNLNFDVNLNQNFYVSSDKIRNELGFHEKYDPSLGLEENVFFSAYQNFGKSYKKYY